MGRPRGSKNNPKPNTEGRTIPNDRKKVFDDFYPLIRAARVEYEEKNAEAKALNGVYRGHLKAYKKAGGDIDELLEAVRLSKMDVGDADRYIRKVNDHLLWLGVPVGTQLGLFQDGQSVATHLENGAMEESLTDEARRHQAKRAGYAAGKMPTVIENPFDPSTDQHGSWQQGFVEAQDELAKGLTTSTADVEGASVN